MSACRDCGAINDEECRDDCVYTQIGRKEQKARLDVIRAIAGYRGIRDLLVLWNKDPVGREAIEKDLLELMDDINKPAKIE